MFFFRNPKIVHALTLATAAWLAGCDRQEIRAYTAPKETPYTPPQAQAQPQQSAHHDGDGHDHGRPEMWRPALQYKVPEGWQDTGPDAANVGTFTAGSAKIAVTALASMAGNEAALVNMWRQVRGQAPLGDQEALKVLTEVPMGDGTGRMFEHTDAVEGGEPRRFMVAFVHRPEGSLFFKIQGSDSAVTEQRTAFLDFIKNTRVVPGATPAPSAPALPPTAKPSAPAAAMPDKPPGTMPEGWQALEPGPMQVAKYRVPEKDGAKAEVAVSVFPNDTGGNAANIQRWRGQLGLPTVDDATALADAKPMEGGPEGAVVVDLKNETDAFVGAIVPRSGQWWFYKLTGGASTVAAARESFINFAKAQP